MHLSTLSPHYVKPVAFALLTAAGVALAPAARAETHVSLSLQLGAPPPVVVQTAPPPPVVEQRIVSPGSGYVWVAGHNSWMHGRWVWVPGTWVRPPQPNTIYVEGRWDEHTRNWIEPHWEIVTPPPPAPVVVVQAPPPPRHEHPGHRPASGYVWLDGYWTWHGQNYVWVPGHWDRPPHGHGKWRAPHWEHRGGSYVFIEGSWY